MALKLKLISVRSHPDSGKLTVDPPISDRVTVTFAEPERRIDGIVVQVNVDLTTGQVEKAIKALLGEGVIEKYPLDL